MDYTKIAKRVILEESNALKILSETIFDDFAKIVNYITSFKGRIILTGIGKSGYIAHKISASFASTGTASFYIHPAEASHGDLGMITKDDIVMMLSNSGETTELLNIVNYCKRLGIKIVVMTMKASSTIATASDFLLCIPTMQEASLIAAPTTSALMMLSLGDALTIAVQEAKGFSKDDFRIYHPGGKIGANLLRVKDLMHKGDNLPLVSPDTSVTDTIIAMTVKRLGCAIVIDNNHRLVGIITDGDLRRHLNQPIQSMRASDLMNVSPKYTSPMTMASEAVFIMNTQYITVLPVIEDNKIVGIIHIHDLLESGVG